MNEWEKCGVYDNGILLGHKEKRNCGGWRDNSAEVYPQNSSTLCAPALPEQSLTTEPGKSLSTAGCDPKMKGRKEEREEEEGREGKKDGRKETKKNYFPCIKT